MTKPTDEEVERTNRKYEERYAPKMLLPVERSRVFKNARLRNRIT